MKNKIKKSLSAKLSIFFISSFSIVIIAIVFSCLSFTSRAFNDFVQKDVNTSLNGLSDTIKTYKKQVNYVGNYLANSNNFKNDLMINNIYSITSTIMTSAKENGLSYIVVMDTNGKVISKNTTEDLAFDKYSKLKHVQLALQGKQSLTTEVVCGKNLCICSATPVRIRSEIIGYVSTVQSLKENEFIDKLKKVSESDFSIFLGNEQINTTFVKNNKRQIGIKTNPDIINKVISNKQHYTGKSNILGNTYMCSYTPILDNQKKAVGVLFAGKNINKINDIFNMLIIASIVIFVLMITVVTLVLNKFIKKLVKNPLNKIVGLANNMEQGEIGISNKDAVALTIDSEDEVGQLASNLGATVNSLQIYVGEISKVLSAISNGDLTVTTEHEYLGDFKNIKEALNNIIMALNKVLYNINVAAESVASRSVQISSNASELSQGATEQASSVQELSATVNEISSQIQKTAENVSVANSIAKESSNEVDKGKKSLDKMLSSMNDISEASTKISKINKTIEDIAFQTNILSLNAAVEAARAGSAGKGFAVVADEVRNLANKSAQASKQTSSLIQNTVSLIEQGTKIANIASESFKGIITSSNKSTDLISQISEAATSQASAITQVSLGINQITQVVQTNSATSEENAAASNELSHQAKILQELVKKFKLNSSYQFTDNSSLENNLSNSTDDMSDKCSSQNKYE